MFPLAVNESGHVVGRLHLSTYGPPHAFVWTPTGGGIDLAPQHRSLAFDVNNAGQVVGYVGGIEAEDDVNCLCARPVTDSKAFIWSARDGMIELGTLGGANSGALEVNDAGQVFGWSEVAVGSGSVHAFAWTPQAGMVDLGPWPNNNPLMVNSRGDALFNVQHLWTAEGGLRDLNTGGYAWALNDSGDVVGSNGMSHAFVWTSTMGMMDLGTLGGAVSVASSINEQRWIVGASRTDPSNQNISHAFLWAPAGGMRDLGTMGGATSRATAVNDRGQVVGVSATTAPGQTQGFVWTETTGMVGLPPLAGYANSEAQFVSNGGYVVGRSFDDGGTERSTLWLVSASPESEDEWTFCAPEGGACAFSGTMEVRYGANGSFVYQTLTDGTACTNGVFGDPIYGTVKECAIRSTPPTTEWTFCAPERGVCAFTGTMEVRYGANGLFAFKTLTDGTACSNEVFGDPIYGVVKSCELRPASGSQP